MVLQLAERLSRATVPLREMARAAAAVPGPAAAAVPRSAVAAERAAILGRTAKTAPSGAYLRFLLQLYPVAPPGVAAAACRVNHDRLHDAYAALPRPAPLYMRPPHLEEFLREFLHRRDFRYGHPVLSARGEPLAAELAAGYARAAEMRHRHVERCTAVAADVRRAALPLGDDERNQLIAMSFFRDKPLVALRVAAHAAPAPPPPPPLTMARYRQLLASFDCPSVDTYNTLLEAAGRLQSHEVVAAIHAECTAPNRKTIGLLLAYLPTADVPSLLRLLAARPIVFDLRTCDAVMAALLRLGLDDTAHRFFAKLYLERPPAAGFGHSLEGVRAYRRALAQYDALGATQQFALAPSEATFHLLTQQAPQQRRVDLVALMARWELPVTTRIYKLLIGGARDLDELHRLTLALLSDHDRAYGDALEFRERARGWPVSESLRRVLEAAAPPLPLPLSPPSHSHVVKLTRDVMEVVFARYAHLANATEVARLHRELALRERGRAAAEVRFYRRAFLLELLDI